MASHGGPDIVTDGLVLCLDGGNTKSYTGSGDTWYDLMSSINGTIDGATFDNGVFDFDGTNDKISVASSSDLTFGTGDFTVEFWAKADDFDSRGTFYDSRPSGGTTGITIGHESSSGEVRVYMNATSGSDIVVQSSDFVVGQWHYIVVTRSSGTVRLFIDGILKDSGTRTSDLDNTNVVNIGYKTYTSSTYDYFDGDIISVRIYKGKGLTATEVTQNYNALNGRVEFWEPTPLPKYKTAFCAQINYDNDDDPSDEKTSFLVTNDDFANVTVFDNKSYIQGSGTQNPCFTTDTIYQQGYWSQFKAIQFDPTITFSTPTTTNTDPQSFAWDPNYPDNLFGVRWSGSMRYTTDKSSPTWLDSTLENSAGVTTSASGYNFGAGYLKDVGIIAVKHWSNPDILRLYKSTDGGVNFTEYQVANWTSWAAQSGAYADFDGGKFMIWGQINGTNSCVSSSDGVNWSVASTSGNIPSGNYRGWLPAVYNKHTSKFYTAEKSTDIGISTDGITWTTDTVSHTTYNVVPLDNGDMVGMHIDGSDAKFTKYPRSGTTIDWSDPTLIKTVSIASNFTSITHSSEVGLYGPYPFQ